MASGRAGSRGGGGGALLSLALLLVGVTPGASGTGAPAFDRESFTVSAPAFDRGSFSVSAPTFGQGSASALAPETAAAAAAVAAGAAAAAAASAAEQITHLRRNQSSDRWLRLISDYVSGAATSGGTGGDGGAVGARSISLQGFTPGILSTGVAAEKTAPLHILVVPVPVPAKEQYTVAAPRAAVETRQFQVPVGQVRLSTGADRLKDSVLRFEPIESSQFLVELFLAQKPRNPELPPAVIPDYAANGESPSSSPDRASGPVRVRTYQVSTPDPTRALSPAAADSDPPVPRFTRSLMLRGELTVPRADYTEPYTVWWDAASGAARVDFHGGATSTYRNVLEGGRVMGIEVRTDRTGQRDVRQCALMAPRITSPGDLAPPGLPDLQYFSFAGFEDTLGGRVERWKHTVSGRSGEIGGVRGEALTFRHELLVARAPDNVTATPLRYTVSVDSSVLGPNCDGYQHRYIELRDQQHDPALFVINIGDVCEKQSKTRRLDRVEPLREFTLPQRDPRYDILLQQYKKKYEQQYLDDTEEAVRKNVLIQHARFVNAATRQSATFAVQLNHLADRLRVEVEELFGAELGTEGFPFEQFPHSQAELDALHDRLPREFDWRALGGVTTVRNQGTTCQSCWAFAVTGAVEGALFARTRSLVKLSEQALIDCAGTYGTYGCKGSWPSRAFDYIRDRGLPALDEYTYQAKMLDCKERVKPVTHISSHVNVTSESVQALKVAIRQHSPTVVIIDAACSTFQFYKTGVLHDERCAKTKKKLKHAVVAVGWGELRGETYFILKNSWGPLMGDRGYYRLHGPSNTCGVLTLPSYPRLEHKDVDEIPAEAREGAGARAG